MMKRRAFLKILPAMAALATWTKLPAKPKINPAWINAPYEAHFLWGKETLEALKKATNEVIASDIRREYMGLTFGVDPRPLRVKLC